MKRKKPYRCVCCKADVTGKQAKRVSRKRAICAPCETLLTDRPRTKTEPTVTESP